MPSSFADAADQARVADRHAASSGTLPMPSYDRARIAEIAGLPVEAVEVVGTTGSTSTALMQRPFRPAAAPPHALVAVEQTAGRGRRGRGWIASPRCSMALSVAVERAIGAAANPYQALPLALGAAIAERLAGFGCALQLKWPNDLQRDGRKVAGLLVEARRCGPVERVVVGVGLNLLADAGLAQAVDQPVAALFVEAGSLPPHDGAGTLPALPERSLLAGALVGTIVDVCARNAAEGFAPWRAFWQAHDALGARPVRVLQADGTAFEGDACGIDDDGALRVRTGQGVRRVLAGEVSVRPIPQA